MFCLEQEVALPFGRNEGPYGKVKFRSFVLKLSEMKFQNAFFFVLGLIICPSRELAKQTYDIIHYFTNCLRQHHCPEIRCCLAIGGVPVSESLDVINR